MDRQKLEKAKAVIAEWKDTCEKFPKNSEASNYYKAIAEVHGVAIECIDKAISQPERKHGHWIYRTDTEYHNECSECHYLEEYNENFCPLCGADMRGE